jgi:hypothetical protein
MVNNGVGTIDNIRKKITKTHELISTSYHEAGHTVYALLHGMKVDSVCVFQNKKNKRVEGFTHFDSPDIEELKDEALISYLVNSEICVRYAGLVAEKHHFKTISGSDKFPMFLRDGSSDDTLTAAALIRQYHVVQPGKKRYAYKKRVIKETLHLLQEYWEDVTLVSHALFQKSRLNYSELKTLLTKKSPNRKYWKEQFSTINYISENHETLDEKTLKSILSV